MFLSRNKKFLSSIIFETLSIFSIIIISLHSYIFSNGFFDYADQYWAPNIYSPQLVYISPVYHYSFLGIFGYTRIFLAGIGLLLSKLFVNPVLAEKTFIIYTFVLFLVFSYILSELIYQIMRKRLSISLSWLKKEVFKTAFVIIIYSNIAIINLNVDGGTWADGLIMLFIMISIAYSIYTDSIYKSIGITGFLISASVLLDPDYFLGFILVIFISYLFIYRKNFLYRILNSISAITLSIPVVLFILYGRVITSSGTIFSALAERPIDTVFGLTNLNIITSLLLIGHLWSTYSISSPYVLSLAGKNITTNYFGNMVIIPRSWITYIWIISISAYPFIAILSLSIKRTFKMALPFAVSWLIAFLLSIWWKIPVLNSIFFKLSSLPFIGSAIGTTLSLGGHYMNIEGISETVLIAILIFNLLYGKLEFLNVFKKGGYLLFSGLFLIFAFDAYSTLYRISVYKISEYNIIIFAFIIILFTIMFNKRKQILSILKNYKFSLERIKKNKSLNYMFILFILFIVIMSGWQAFDGSFYPQRSFDGSSNGPLSTTSGPYSAIYIPQYIINACNEYTKNSSYNTIFYAPQLPNNLDNVYEKKDINYLICNNYSSSLSTFLDFENIKYIITYDDISNITNTLNDSGLYHWSLGPDSYIYQNNHTLGNVYNGDLLINYSSLSEQYIFAYKILHSMNLTPVFTETGNNTLGFNNYSSTININSPLFLISNSLSSYNVNSNAAFSNNATYNFSHSSDSYLANNWYIGSGPKNIIIKTENDTLLWNTENGTQISVCYGNFTTPGGYKVIPLNNYLHSFTVANISFQYKTTKNFNGNITSFFGYIYDINGNPKFPEYTTTSNAKYNASSEWIKVSYKILLPKYTRYFAPCIYINGSAGAIKIRNINVSWETRNIPYNSCIYEFPLRLNSSSVDLPTNGTNYLLLSGNGTINNVNMKLPAREWVSLKGGVTKFGGNLTLWSSVYIKNTTIKSIEGNYTVLNEPYNANMRLVNGNSVYTPIYTLTGQALFKTQMSKGAYFELKNANFIEYGYIAILIYLTMMLVTVFVPIPYFLRRRK